jgi:hypothetical protein
VIVDLDAAQRRNFLEAMAVATSPAERVRLVFAIWTETSGYNHSNDGRNLSESPGVTPERVVLLRRSLDPEWQREHGLQIDRVGSNGRSTGVLQQISADVGGGWGDMVGTLRPAVAAQRFLQELVVTDNEMFKAVLLVGDTSRLVLIQRDPIAADVLRVQRPLAPEAESANYNDNQVAIARAIVAQLEPTITEEIVMATLEDVKNSTAEAVKGLKFNLGTFYDRLGGNHYMAYPDGSYMAVPNPTGNDEVWRDHMNYLGQMGVEVVDFGQADPFRFGHEILWSDRPARSS